MKKLSNTEAELKKALLIKKVYNKNVAVSMQDQSHTAFWTTTTIMQQSTLLKIE